MQTVSIEQYWMGRDVSFARELTGGIRVNAEELLGRVNLLLERAAAEGVEPGVDQMTGNAVASGWRPHGINDRTLNAAATSKHITAQAVDLQDNAHRDLARWCLRNLDVLEELELWMEDPRWTGGADPWVHLQMVPPGSGRRVYVPSTAPPRAAALIEQGGTA